MQTSVIIATLNQAAALESCLEALLKQTVAVDEIIVVDEGSSDKSLALLESYGVRVKLLQQNSSNKSAAFNRGLHAANGEWLALIDPQSEWLPNKLARQLEFVEERPDCRVVGCRSKSKQSATIPHGWIFEKILAGKTPSLDGIIFHRTVMEKIGLLDESLSSYAETDFLLRMSSRYPIEILKTPLLLRHRKALRLSAAAQKKQRRDATQSLTKIRDHEVLPDDWRQSLEKALKKLQSRRKGNT